MKNETYLIKVWDHIPQQDGTAKNVPTVIGRMKPQKDKDGNIVDGKFQIFIANNVSLSDRASVELYEPKRDETSEPVSE